MEANISGFVLLFDTEVHKFYDTVISSGYVLEKWNRCVLPSSLRGYNIRSCLSWGAEAFAAVGVSWSNGVISLRVLSMDLLEALKQNCLSEPNQFSQEPLKQLLLIILGSLTSGNSGYHQSWITALWKVKRMSWSNWNTCGLLSVTAIETGIDSSYSMSYHPV